MTREELDRLLGGYAAGTLTDEERSALFEAALTDQALFDALAKEEPLRDALADPSSRARVLAALNEPPRPAFERLAAWLRKPQAWALAAGVTAAVVIGGVALRSGMLRKAKPERQQIAMVRRAPVPAPAPREPLEGPKALSRNNVSSAPDRSLTVAAQKQLAEPRLSGSGRSSGVAGSIAPNAGSARKILAESKAKELPPAPPEPAGVAGGVVGSPASAPPPAPPAQETVTVTATAQKLADRGSGSPQEIKIDPVLTALVARATSGKPLSSADAKLVRDGKVAVQVWLNYVSEAVLAQIKALGFETTVQPKTANVIVGRIAVEKLIALSQLSPVRYIAPRQ